jgi:carbonic anhydrase
MKPHPRLKHLAVFVVVVGGVAYWRTNLWSESALSPTPTTPDAALNELRSGNLRFVNSRRTHSTDTRHDADDRRRTAKGQHPFAAILCCSDSRVCPEFIFDQRAGTIFEVRNAGNVVDEDVLASLEYAVEHLHVPLVVVLGHKGCGAIEAVCEAGERPLHDHLRALQTHMQGIHKQVIECHHRHDADVVNHLAEENAKQQALGVLRDSPALKAAVGRGEARLVYGLYDMETGVVELFDLDGDPP